MNDEEITLSAKIGALDDIVRHNPAFLALIVVLNFVIALLEGFGLSFIVPVINVAQSDGGASTSVGGLQQQFIRLFEFFSVPFTLENVIIGVSLIMFFRFSGSFVAQWMRVIYRTHVVKSLQEETFRETLSVRMAYFERMSTDLLVNAIVTQSRYTERAVNQLIQLNQNVAMVIIYVALAFSLTRLLTVAAVVILLITTGFVRLVVDSGYDIGEKVAKSNEEIHETVQSSLQGLHDVRLFNLEEKMYDRFEASLDEQVDDTIRLVRNQSWISNGQQATSAITVFILVYFALEFTTLQLGELALFLFAMLRLGPRASTINNQVYAVEGALSHLVRSRNTIDDLRDQQQVNTGSRTTPDTVNQIAFSDVSFTYDDGTCALNDVSFSFEIGEFVAVVGPSGAGKSTLVSLLARLYEPDSGAIEVDSTPISEFDVSEWREHLAVVPQDPFIFNDTLKKNVAIANSNASTAEIERACDVAHVSEFVSDLPEGYRTVLGDDGVRLSGGQRQRVAIARALVTDADVLVLDEGLSDLDRELERAIHSAIKALDRDMAILVIAHRLSTIEGADVIHTMEDSVIVESGTHEALLDSGGKYATLRNVNQ